MKALRIYAGPVALQSLRRNGLLAQHVAVIPGAAGGPKGLVLGPLDRFIFGHWLPQSDQPVHLVGASIGAWRMAAACLNNPVEAFLRLEADYIAQHYELKPGQKRHSPSFISQQFEQNLQSFYGGRVPEVLSHPRFRLHIMASRGQHVLAREQAVRTPLGYAGAFLSNVVARRAMGTWLERVVFSSKGSSLPPSLPFATADYRTRQVDLTEASFMQALLASCSIPFVLQSVQGIPGAPPGAYWDGGIVDYHLHLDYLHSDYNLINNASKNVSAYAYSTATTGNFDSEKGKNGLAEMPQVVLYPHFQKAVIPGWLDKGLKWRHKATRHLDRMVLLAPDPDWIKTLPNSKLPDRTDFTHYGNDKAGRQQAWRSAVSASSQLADEFAAWLHQPDISQVQTL